MNDPTLKARAIAVFRIFSGVVFLTNGLAKLVPGISGTRFGFLIDSSGARGIIAHDAKNHPVHLYHELVYNLFLPNWSVFGPLVGITETAAGLMLVLGVASAAGAVLAALLSLHIQFAALFINEWLYEYAVEWVPLLCLALMASGRTWGLDGRLAARSPRWARWF